MNHQGMMGPVLAVAALAIVLAVAGVPVLNYAPLLVFLVCPLMMFFMMRGHGDTKEHSSRDSRQDHG
jgi:hypothetical protein